jgi:hypothetical protein
VPSRQGLVSKAAEADRFANAQIESNHVAFEPVEPPLTPRRVAVYYYRSQHYHLGDAKCWVDDNERGAVMLKGYWAKQYNVAV